MNDDDRTARHHAARGELIAAEAAPAEAHAALSRAVTALDSLAAELLQGAIAARPAPTAPTSEHRRAHRPGRRSSTPTPSRASSSSPGLTG